MPDTSSRRRTHVESGKFTALYIGPSRWEVVNALQVLAGSDYPTRCGKRSSIVLFHSFLMPHGIASVWCRRMTTVLRYPPTNQNSAFQSPNSSCSVMSLKVQPSRDEVTRQGQLLRNDCAVMDEFAIPQSSLLLHKPSLYFLHSLIHH